MTFKEANAAAEALDAEATDCLIIAIGRFVPIEHITPETPWKISVCVDGERKVIETRAECDRIIAAGKRTRLAPVGMLF